MSCSSLNPPPLVSGRTNWKEKSREAAAVTADDACSRRRADAIFVKIAIARSDGDGEKLPGAARGVNEGLSAYGYGYGAEGVAMAAFVLALWCVVSPLRSPPPSGRVSLPLPLPPVYGPVLPWMDGDDGWRCI